jgi:anti-sigma regulatory factor (Ser/Thr protein kinase)
VNGQGASSPESAVRARGAERFAEPDLPRVRENVRAAALAAGLGPQRVTDLVLAVHELAVNSVMHGGGSGSLRQWVEGGALFVEVADRGRFPAEAVPGEAADAARGARPEGGLGLRIVRRACDSLEIRRDPEQGTVIRVAMAIRPDAPGSTRGADG